MKKTLESEKKYYERRMDISEEQRSDVRH